MKKEPVNNFGGDKVPPHSIDLEQGILGAMIIDPISIGEVIGILKEEHFYRPEHQKIFKAIKSMHDNMLDIDIMTVNHSLQQVGDLESVGGTYYLTQLTGRMGSGAHILTHSLFVIEQYFKRRGDTIGKELQAAAQNGMDPLVMIREYGKKLEDLDTVSLTATREITFKSEPQKDDVIIKFMGARFLSIGNISGIIAHPGIGKSNICDAIAAAALNSHVDTLGFSVNRFGKNVYHADTERSYNDSIAGYWRTSRRMELDSNTELSDGNKIKNYTFEMYKEVGSIDARWSKLQKVIVSGRYKLIIIDGLSDFMAKGVNDEAESNEVVMKLGAMASKYQVAILCTIHDNPKSVNKGAPRGHLGSELARKSEGLLLVDKAEGDGQIKVIKSEFSAGKMRNDGGELEKFIKWDRDIKHMFVSIDYKPPRKDEKVKAEAKELFEDIFRSKKWLSKADLTKAIMKRSGCSQSTAYNKIKDAVAYEWLVINERGEYNIDKDAAPF